MLESHDLKINSQMPIERLLKSKAYIGGLWINSQTQVSVRDPHTNAGLARVAILDEHEQRQALERAHRGWQVLLPEQRQSALSAWLELIGNCQNALALIQSSELGCCWDTARAEMTTVLSNIQHRLVHINSLDRPCTKPVLTIDGCPQSPLSSIIDQAVPAMIAGSAVVVRPPRQTPLGTLALAAIAEQANLPSGAFNVVPF